MGRLARHLGIVLVYTRGSIVEYVSIKGSSVLLFRRIVIYRMVRTGNPISRCQYKHLTLETLGK